jgi:Zn-dependent alcohol dehydrogenase
MRAISMEASSPAYSNTEDFELDPPHAGEVFVRMAAAGLCHSDEHILQGDMYAPNEVLRSQGLPTDETFRHHTTNGRPLGHISKIGAFAEHTVVSANSIVKIEPYLPLVPIALLSCAIPTDTGRPRTVRACTAATRWSSSGRAASAPPRSRARASTGYADRRRGSR